MYLSELSEPRDNSLRIVIEKAALDGAPPAEPDDLHAPVVNIDCIKTTTGCRIVELFWAHYVAYLVTEEMAGSGGNDDDESYTGKLFRVYDKSHFLDHLARDTGNHLGQNIRHFKLTCLNHLIDVAAYTQPEIRISVKK